MDKLLKYSIALILSVIVSTSSYSQLTDTIIPHISDTQQLSKFRQLIWDSLPRPISWVTDLENLYTDKEQTQLDNVISKFEKETSIEIAIITIDTVYVAKQNFEDFALHIARKWGVGKKEKNNGILIAISKGYRTMRIENGYGIEKILTDTETKQIIDNYFIPGFKNAEYFKGTMTGLKEIIKRLKNRSK